MLKLVVPAGELWDEKTQQFITTKEQTLQLEHSLVSLSKWESIWNKPFLSKEQMTYEETISYIQCMTMTQNVDPNVYKFINNNHIEQVRKYIESPMTATTFSDNKKGGGREIITNEIIYYWMVALNIPMECQKWHLNHLLTLIKVCDIKNQPAKKMSKKDLAMRNSKLNAARRSRLNSRG